MGDKIVEVPGVGNVSFPASMSDDQISSVLQSQNRTQPSKPTIDSLGGADMIRALTMKAMRESGVKTPVASPQLPKPPAVPFSDPVNSALINVGSKVAALPESIVRGSVPGQAVSSAAESYGAIKQMSQGVPLREVQRQFSERHSLSGELIGALGIDKNEVANDAENGNYGALAGDTAFPLLMTALGGKLARKAGVSGASDVVPPEVQARNLTKAVLPYANEWNNYISANSAEMGNIKAFAEKNGLPLDTQLDWSKAAKQSAEATKNYYQNDVLGPVANKSVSLPNGDMTTLGQIDSRITWINDQLRQSYVKRNSGQTMSALANEPDLLAEKSMLVDKLHEGIAKSTNLTPEQVAQIRQRFGRQYTIADETTSAVNQRQLSAGKAAEGRRDVPQSFSGMTAEFINRMRGGAEGISNSKFKRVMKRNSVPTSDLPAVEPRNAPVLTRKPVWQMSPEEVKAYFASRASTQ